MIVMQPYSVQKSPLTGTTIIPIILATMNNSGNYLNNKREYEYIYDIHNRLISVSRYNESTTKELLISFEYDPLGRRMSKRIQNQLIEYIYD